MVVVGNLHIVRGLYFQCAAGVFSAASETNTNSFNFNTNVLFIDLSEPVDGLYGTVKSGFLFDRKSSL